VVTDWPLDADRLAPGITCVRGVAPYTSRWFELWRRADVFVMASRHEAFGMVYQEAAASGIPVIATKINAIPEIVDDGVTGILVNPDDPRALTQAICALVDSAALRQQMGYAARRRIEQRGSILSYSVGLDAIINSVLRQHGSRVG
jgi:glycosyltransferase involved in cell wall biosynthesis